MRVLVFAAHADRGIGPSRGGGGSPDGRGLDCHLESAHVRRRLEGGSYWYGLEGALRDIGDRSVPGQVMQTCRQRTDSKINDPDFP